METSMINKVLMFSINEFDDWRIRMEVHLAAMHEEMIFVIQDGPIKTMKVNTTARVEGQEHDVYVEKDRDQWTADDRKRANLDNVAKNTLFVTLDKDTFSKVKSCKTAKEIWDKLKHICEGTELSKENKISKLTQQFEFFEMKPTEMLEELDLRFTEIVLEHGGLLRWVQAGRHRAPVRGDGVQLQVVGDGVRSAGGGGDMDSVAVQEFSRKLFNMRPNIIPDGIYVRPKAFPGARDNAMPHHLELQGLGRARGGGGKSIVEVVPTEGHLPQLSAPKLTIQVIVRHIQYDIVDA
ncbi:hypothetical protein OROMI_000785 [Orobanche minor]